MYHRGIRILLLFRPRLDLARCVGLSHTRLPRRARFSSRSSVRDQPSRVSCRVLSRAVEIGQPESAERSCPTAASQTLLLPLTTRSWRNLSGICYFRLVGRFIGWRLSESPESHTCLAIFLSD